MRNPARLLVLAPFSLADAPNLPLIGEFHPLRREFERWMSLGHALALVLGICLLVAPWRDPTPLAAPPEIRVQIRDTFVIGRVQPPPASSRHEGQIVGTVPPVAGTPEPVAWDPELFFDPSSLEGGAPGAIGGGEVQIPAGPSIPGTSGSGPTIFTPSPEVMPVLLHLVPPAYPDLARESGLEGTVWVRILVGTDGRVKQAVLLEGNPILASAALASARTAVFQPARQRDRPVEAWVDLPVAFSMR